MAQLFTGHASPDSIDRLVVQSERKADKIRSEGIEQLKGMQDVYQHHVNESNQIINALKEKASAEDKYRREAFEFDLEANQYYNDAVIRNLKQEVLNTQTKGENEQRAIKAISQIIPATVQIAQTAREAQKKRIQKRAASIEAILPESKKDREKQSLIQDIIEQGDTQEERDQLWEDNTAYFQAQGISKDDLDRFFNADGFRLQVIQESFAVKEAQNLTLENISSIKMDLGSDVGSERSGEFFFSKGSKEEFDTWKQLTLNHLAKQMVGDPENDKDGPYSRAVFNKHIAPVIKEQMGNISLKVDRRLKKEANERDAKTKTEALGNVLNRGGREKYGDNKFDIRGGIQHAYDYTVKQAIKSKQLKANKGKTTDHGVIIHSLTGAELKEVTYNFVRDMETLAKINGIGGDEAKVLRDLRYFIPKGGWSGDKKTPLFKKFPDLGDSLKQVHKEIVDNQTKELQANLDEIKNNKARDKIEITEMVNDPTFRGTKEEFDALEDRYAGHPDAHKLIGSFRNSSANSIYSKRLALDLSLQAKMGTLDNWDIFIHPDLTIEDKLKLVGLNGASKTNAPEDSMKRKFWNQNKELIKKTIGKGGVPPHQEGWQVMKKTNQMILQWHKDYDEGMVLYDRDKGKALEYAQEKFEEDILNPDGNYAVLDKDPNNIRWKYSKANFERDPGIVQDMRKVLTSKGNKEHNIRAVLRSTDVLSYDNLEEFGLNLNAPAGAKPTELAYRLAKSLSGKSNSVSPWELMVPQYHRFLEKNPERAKELGLKPIPEDILETHGILKEFKERQTYLNPDYAETDQVKQPLLGLALYNEAKKAIDPTYNIWSSTRTWNDEVAEQYFSLQLNGFSELPFEQQQRVYQYYVNKGGDVSHLEKLMKKEEVVK